MLGQCWGLSWAHVGSFDGLYGLPWRFLEGKNNLQRDSLSVEGYFGWLFGTMSGQCWAMLGRFGSMLGPCWVIWCSERSFQKLLHGVDFGLQGYVRPMLGQCWAMWAHVGLQPQWSNSLIAPLFWGIESHTSTQTHFGCSITTTGDWSVPRVSRWPKTFLQAIKIFELAPQKAFGETYSKWLRTLYLHPYARLMGSLNYLKRTH